MIHIDFHKVKTCHLSFVKKQVRTTFCMSKNNWITEIILKWLSLLLLVTDKLTLIFSVDDISSCTWINRIVEFSVVSAMSAATSELFRLYQSSLAATSFPEFLFYAPALETRLCPLYIQSDVEMLWCSREWPLVMVCKKVIAALIQFCACTWTKFIIIVEKI